MGICYVIGLILGGVAQYTVAKHVQRYKEEHPIPNLHGPSAGEPSGAALAAADATPLNA